MIPSITFLHTRRALLLTNINLNAPSFKFIWVLWYAITVWSGLSNLSLLLHGLPCWPLTSKPVSTIYILIKTNCVGNFFSRFSSQFPSQFYERKKYNTHNQPIINKAACTIYLHSYLLHSYLLIREGVSTVWLFKLI